MNHGISSTDQAATRAAVLQANGAFYEAFSNADVAAMTELWAKHAHVACFHPAAPAVLGREAVLASFRQILRHAPPGRMRCEEAVVTVLDGTAIVTCYEGSGEQPAHLAATNVFVLEEGAWRMVHHHAGVLAKPIPRTTSSSLVN